MHSLNKVDENIEKISRLFPNCSTEHKGESGKVEYAIGFNMPRQETYLGKVKMIYTNPPYNTGKDSFV